MKGYEDSEAAAAVDLQGFYVDLHIHIGRTAKGQPVKISGAANLTFYNIAHEASERKGIDMVGIIDCHSPPVQEEMEGLLASGEMEELERGGIRYRNTTVILGCELEVYDPGTSGPAHLLAYLPTLAAMKSFTAWLIPRMKNVTLSSQRVYAQAREVQQQTAELGGILIPAHIFTPHKSLYGSAVNRMPELLDPTLVAAVELGLSSDSEMASYISELDAFPFVTDSDAHSFAKIGREYNAFLMASPCFEELVMALRGEQGRRILVNYGLNPRLGKYHRTYCEACGTIAADSAAHSVESCSSCGSKRITRGVMDRIHYLADREQACVPDNRPPYIYQVPLEFIPGLGPKLLNRLLDRFGTEMNILHLASQEELAEIANPAIAQMIVQAREGSLLLSTGGGGQYGRVLGTSPSQSTLDP